VKETLYDYKIICSATLPNNFTDTLLAAYTAAVKAIKEAGLEHSTMKAVEPGFLVERMIRYYMYGDAAFLNPWGYFLIDI
jgi:hypothetical protein